MSKAAMKLALEALEQIASAMPFPVGSKAITAIRQALAAQPAVQEPVGYLEIDDIESQREYPHNCRNVNLWHEGGQGMAAIYTTSPAPTVQEPVAWMVTTEMQDGTKNTYPLIGRFKDVKDVCDFGDPVPLYTAPPAQPAQQKPVATLWQHGETGRTRITMPGDITDCDARWFKASDLYTTPLAAQPAIPDALTSADIQEHIEYVAGWNDCRQAMMEMMK